MITTNRQHWIEFAHVLGEWVAGCELANMESELYLQRGELGVQVALTAFVGDEEITGRGDHPEPHRAALTAVAEFARRMAALKGEVQP